MTHAMLVVGHSHIGAIRGAARLRREADPDAPRTRTIHAREPRFAPELTEDGGRFAAPLAGEIARQIALHRPRVASVFGGNAHNALSLLRHERAFDFHLSGEPSPALEPGVERIPEAAVQAALAAHIAPDMARLRALRAAAGPFVQIESPPPLRDERTIAAAADAFFVERGITPAAVAPAGLRFRMWRLSCRLFRAQATALGCAYLPVPDAVRDAEGFLPAALAGDATHGNDAYGEAILRALEAL